MSKQYEFGGPLGTLVLIVALPLVVLFLAIFVEDGIFGVTLDGLSDLWDAAKEIRLTHLMIWIGWLTFQAILHVIAPGKMVEGSILRDGTKLKYMINAFLCFVITHYLLVLYISNYGTGSLVWIADNYVQLAFVAWAYSFLQSIALYVYSHRQSLPMLSIPGSTGNVIYDFWMGRELNPRLFGFFDLKYFCELRPGMFLWAILNYAHAAKQYQDLRHLSPSMILVVAFQSIYIADSVFHEHAILTTMDIIMDGFGFMLSFGDLVWVPFTFSLQSKYLALEVKELSKGYLVAVSILFFISYVIFRQSNNQKNRFRSDPEHPKSLNMKYIKTESGSKLLVDGWWKYSRHPNYLGDWLMGLSWCLLTGLPSHRNAFAYFYAIYFAILLVHRALRDDHKCRQKYGKDWEKYCKMVPYRIIPFLY